MMRFDSGLLCTVGDISQYPQVDEWLGLARILESSGYTGVWSAEHHFAWDTGITPTPTNPLLMGAYFASATKRLRIGQCGVTMSAHHPLRVAEDTAMLDHMTKGRMEFGFMKGVSDKVSLQFDPASHIQRDHKKTNSDLMWESFDIIKKCWSGTPFKHEGRYFSFPRPWSSPMPKHLRDSHYYDDDGTLVALRGLPTPFQKPIPPCWVMADSVPSTVQAAERGVGTVCWAQTFEGTREVWTAYRQAAAEAAAAGKLPEGANSRVAFMRPFFIAEDSNFAKDVLRKALTELLGKRHGQDKWIGRRAMLASWEELTPAEKECDWLEFLLGRSMCVVGSPEEVTDQLKRYEEELGAEHFIMYWALPFVTYEMQLAAIKLFSERVMPHFKEWQPSRMDRQVMRQNLA